MKASLPAHLSDDQLRAFANGMLVEQEFVQAERHLAGCNRCCEQLLNQPDSAFLELARAAASTGLAPTHGRRADAPAKIPPELRDHPRYRVLKRIGSGGMGAVYLAEHLMMQRRVALKVVHPALLTQPNAIERFQREVRAAARLSHPHIVAAFDADQAGESRFLVMEYVEGESLDQGIERSGPLPVGSVCRWMRQAALGLQHAHEQGMTHRDIKPHNLMITRDGQLKILDFGLTRLNAEASGQLLVNAPQNPQEGHLTHDGLILGTPDYIAPEQIADSRAVDIRADIYSLGCTLYHALSGQPPYARDTVLEKLYAHTRTEFPRLAAVRPDAPVRLQKILSRMTAKDPQARYQTPGELAEELATLADSDTVVARAAHARTPIQGIAPPVTAPSPPVIAQAPTRISPLTTAASIRPAASAAFAPSVPRKSNRTAILAGAGLLVLLTLGGLAAWSQFGGGDSSVNNGPRKNSVTPVVNANMRKLLMLLPSTGLWYGDYQRVVDAIATARQANGAKLELVVAGTSLDQAQVLPDSPSGPARADVLLGPSVRAADYDAILLIGFNTSEFAPGGPGGDDTARLLREFQAQGKYITTLCAGQRLLAEHDFVRGKRLATCPNVVETVITNAGGRWSSEMFTRDGRLFSGATENEAPQMIQALLEAFGQVPPR